MSIRSEAGPIIKAPTAARVVGTPSDLSDFFDDLLADEIRPSARTFTSKFGHEQIGVELHGFPVDDDYGRALLPGDENKSNLLTIHVIDGERCGVDRPRLAWTRSDFGPKRVVPGWSDADRTTYLLRGEGGLGLADWTKRRAFLWLPSHRALPWYERAAPFRWLFDGVAERTGLSALHAGAVGYRGNGVLIVGQGGAGKSTLALACLGEGLDYIGDDYCLISNHQPEVFSLYSTAKWKTDADVTPEWLDHVEADAMDRQERKSILYVETVKPEGLVQHLSIRAIVAPAIDRVGPSRLDPMAKHDALRDLAASSLAQSEADGRSLAAAAAYLVRTVPAYRLSMTPRLTDSVNLVRGLLGRKPE